MKFFTAFKKLPKGVYRLNIACSFLLPLIVALIGEASERHGNGEMFLVCLIMGIPIYWLLARIGVWIYSGFKEDKNQ